MERVLKLTNIIARSHRDDPPCKREIMSCSDHRPQLLLTLVAIGLGDCKRADAALAGKSERGFDRPCRDSWAQSGAILSLDPSMAKRRRDATRAKPAPRHRLAARITKGAIIDIPERSESLGDCQSVWRLVREPLMRWIGGHCLPAPRTDFAVEIVGEPLARGREPLDIAQREPVQ